MDAPPLAHGTALFRNQPVQLACQRILSVPLSRVKCLVVDIAECFTA